MSPELRNKLRVKWLFIYISYKCEAYLKLVTFIKHRITLNKLRLFNHCLAIEKGEKINVRIAEIIVKLRDITVGTGR